MNSSPRNILFLCTGNSARSILAEAIMNRVDARRFRGYSAGSHPTGTVNPHAMDLLKGLSHPTDGLRSKAWDEFADENAPRLDFIFTVCDQAAGETCPIWPGRPVSAHWGLPDPAAVTGNGVTAAFANTYRALHHRIEAFANLPFDTLDPDSLRARLDAIGRESPESA